MPRPARSPGPARSGSSVSRWARAWPFARPATTRKTSPRASASTRQASSRTGWARAASQDPDRRDFFFGALDREVNASERGSLKKVLGALGKDVTLEEYGGAGHDFFCSDRNTFHVGAAKKSWDETLAFFRARLG